MFRQFRSIARAVCCAKCPKTIPAKRYVRTLLLATVPTAVLKNNLQPLKAPDPNELTHTYLLKNAAVSTIDSASALLTQGAVALLEVLADYQDALECLMKLLELHLEVIGDRYREDRVWDSLMEVRGQVNEARQKKQTLEVIYSCAQKALQAAAEAAHSAGAEYAGVAANERVYSATTHVEYKARQVEEAEAKLRKLEARCIEEVSKKAKEKEKQTEVAEKQEQENQDQDNQNIEMESATNDDSGNNKDEDLIIKDIFDMPTEEEPELTFESKT